MLKKKNKLLKKKSKPLKVLKKASFKKAIKKSVKKTKAILVKKKIAKKKPISVKKIKHLASSENIKKPTPKKIHPKTEKKDFLPQSFFRAKIKVVGIGGGGGSIVSEMGKSLHKATFVVADTDMRSFKKRKGIKQFLFGQKLTHGLGTGVNPELGRLAAESEKEKIAQLFNDQDIVIFVASLGGGLGSGATQVFLDSAKDFSGITLGIFTLPFKFEGKQKHTIALRALSQLRNSLNVSITIPNEKIFKIINANTAITDAFSMVNKNLIESLESLIDLIYNPGIINIDFADVRSILKGKGNLAFLNTAEAQGKNRTDDIIQRILHNPLYQQVPMVGSGGFTAEKILFNIEGGGSLSMFEVDKISRAISAINPNAKIIFGISKNSTFNNKIKTTLLMTGPGVVPAKLEIKEKLVVIKKELPKEKKSEKKITKKQETRLPARQAITAKKKKKLVKPESSVKEGDQEKISLPVTLPEVFGRPNSVIAAVGNSFLEAPALDSAKTKKAIRRNALEIKKAEEVEEQKQSLQEKEWEIPAFLRIKK